VLLTCFNRREKTIQSLGALFASIKDVPDICIEIFLVDDGSTDDTAYTVERSFPSVKLIYGNGKLFWNRGMIKAWKQASQHDFDFYLWLNDDTIISKHGLKIL